VKASFEVILDTGPLVAWLSHSDQHHEWCSRVLENLRLPLVTTEAVIAETAHHLLGYDQSADALCEILESGALEIAPISNLGAVCTFMRRYQTDFTDASIVWLSEQYPRATVFTVDFGDFRVYRRFKNQVIPLVGKPSE
jgi:predicted nucleic acid-binding protein